MAVIEDKAEEIKEEKKSSMGFGPWTEKEAIKKLKKTTIAY